MINRRKKNYILLIILIGITVATLYPFNFTIANHFSLPEIVEKFSLASNITDYVRNILLFIPVGIFLAASINSKKYSFFKRIVISFLVSIILSSNIELLQILLPTRNSCLCDIICNSIGGTLGAILYCYRENIFALVNAIVTNNYEQVSWQFLLTVVIGYCLTLTVAIWLLIANVSLNNWNDDYYLAVGNEVNGKIGWDGYITSLYISDRDLNPDEIAKAFSKTHTFFVQLPSSIASFVFIPEQQTYRDLNQQLPELVWQKIPSNSKNKIDRDRARDKLGIKFDNKNYLITKDPASVLSKRIKQNDRFTIGLTVAAEKFNKVGPARIVSFSKNQFYRNFMIGQEGQNLALQLRTTTTKKTANKPTFIVPNVFSDRAWHQILITYAEREINIYIDHQNNKYTYKFLPATSIHLYLPWYTDSWRVNLAELNIGKLRATFYGIILLPLAVLIRALMLCWNSDRL